MQLETRPKAVKPGHSDRGAQGILINPSAYRLFSKILLREKTRVRYVEKYIKPFPGCKILDIGCGPADILEYLPDDIGEYSGFDMNQEYVNFASRRWGDRGEFRCERVSQSHNKRAHYDIVLANGIVHHLDQEEARQLFMTARTVLKPGGHLVTYDNVYIENQNWFAKFMNSQDRGKYVRPLEDYTALAGEHFNKVETAILHDTLRVPYTILIMRCLTD
ncbi:MAG TPA: class I SAM-dependent methyltransferase [Candidatus Melainabacteria bacterium]|nr:class I SAM-dependent methyltransferase [Candidatus Melainabacteria bacterium]